MPSRNEHGSTAFFWVVIYSIHVQGKMGYLSPDTRTPPCLAPTNGCA